MDSIVKSVGHGLLAAGILLIILYVFGAYLRGSEAFRDALDPTAMKTYLALVPLAPGLLMLWLADRLVARRRASSRSRARSAAGSPQAGRQR